jgi:RNA polymerase sigma factor (TIGR02999 family)
MAHSTCNTESPPPADHAAAQVDALFTALYADLCRLARREVRHNGARDVLGTSTLVHEAWLDIRHQPSLAFENTGKFLAYASRTMRGLVIDRVRAQHAQKRGGALAITSLDTHHAEQAEQAAQPEFLADVGDALDELSALQPELARVVDLKFFCGFGLAEVAAITGVSERTVQRQWQTARMLLYRALNEG